ncbi:MAG TPA: ribosome maturation factor RimP [Acidimicrobiales bacterium]|nr:ribosome maturation factor RimP [Acidimicrobiales bacterium]
MTVAERVRDLVQPLLADRDLDLYDVELAGPVLRVVVDRPGGLDLGVLSDATRAVSRALDESDPIPGHYTLEVTTPGLERALRTPWHFARAVGETVRIRTVAGSAGEDRRVAGVLSAADDDGITVRTGTDDAGAPVERRLPYADIERARTVFAWGPGEKPGKARRAGAGRQATSNEKREHRS